MSEPAPSASTSAASFFAAAARASGDAARNTGSTIERQIEVGERIASSSARNPAQDHDATHDRSEERRVGKEGVSKCRSRWTSHPSQKKYKTIKATANSMTNKHTT